MSGATGSTADQSPAPFSPAINLPKGGGAVRGIGEKFSVNNASNVFKWLLERTFDDKGNVIFYKYKPEDTINIIPAAANERNRQNGIAPFANLYVKRIYYGPQAPYQREEDLSKRTDWLFEVVFDYGEHDDPANPTPAEDPARKWNTRADPFSNFRSTFDIRTYRLCQRVLMFHHFPKGKNGEAGFDGPVRSTTLSTINKIPSRS